LQAVPAVLGTAGNSRHIKESNVLLTSCTAARRGSSRLSRGRPAGRLWHALFPVSSCFGSGGIGVELFGRLPYRKLKASQAIPRPSPQRALSMAGWSSDLQHHQACAPSLDRSLRSAPTKAKL
jgi:hypothetical protein